MAKKQGRALKRPHIKFLAKRVGKRKDHGVTQSYSEFTDVCVFPTVGITDLYLVKSKLRQGWQIIEYANFPDESQNKKEKPYTELLEEIEQLRGSRVKAKMEDADFNNYALPKSTFISKAKKKKVEHVQG